MLGSQFDLAIRNKEAMHDFAELLLQIRTEEDKRSSKLDRMHRHFGSSKAKPIANVNSLHDLTPLCPEPGSEVLQTYISETEKLRKQVVGLQLQLSTKPSKKQKKKTEGC